jgi:sortase A
MPEPDPTLEEGKEVSPGAAGRQVVLSERIFRGFDVPAARWIERLLLLVGLICLGTVAYAYFDARLTDIEENRRLEEAIHSHKAQPASETDALSSFQATEAPAPPKLEEGALVGRLEIPRVGVSSIVLEGVASRTLRRGIGHIPGTGLPFQNGNVGLAGHRDSFFRALQDIREDDLITLKTLEGTYEYRVEWSKIVQPADTQVLAATGEPVLTLVTCYPFYYVGSAPERFIVRARRADQKTAG